MIGRRIGAYDVVAVLGEGGMGQVFRARDAALGREVAIKVLPSAAAGDRDRRDRFVREARVLASLSHPHIARIYSVEDLGDGLAIVMELVEGQPLDAVIRAGRLPRRQALAIARDIAEALDAAHEQGIIHRDLKPANVIVGPDGSARVLDFGLAKTAGGPDAGSMTTAGLTSPGAVLGTPAYMSPEQARGQAVDRRTDVWALGCVLFELLSGRRAFDGATVSDTIAALLERDPDWAALPAETPPSMTRLIRRCLEKDRRERLRDIGDALHDLQAESSGTSSPAASGAEHPSGSSRRLTWTLAAAAAVLGASTIWLLVDRSRSVVTPPLGASIRFDLPAPPGTRYRSDLSEIEATTIAMAPDGLTLAFVAAEGRTPAVWIRDFSADRARRVNGTDGATSVFWAPDGRSLGFFADGQLKRVDAAGGTAVKICDVPVGIGLSGTWGANGDILFATVQGDGIRRVSAAGGEPTMVIAQVPTETPRVLWPRFLPGSSRFLYTAIQPDLRSRIRLTGVDGTAVDLVEADSQAQWVDPHWLLYVRAGTLLAQQVDLESVRLVDAPRAVAGPIAYSAATGWSDFTASVTGTLAFQAHANVSRVAWFDRTGRELRTTGTPAGYFTLRTSYDASKLLFSRMRAELGTFDLWIVDLTRQSETPVTTSPGMETGEVWVPGERAVLFAAARGGPPNVFRKDLVTGEEVQLQASPRFQFPNDVHPAGTLFAFQQRTELGTWDLMTQHLSGGGEAAPLFASAASEFGLRFSPTGRQMAFVSDESRRLEVYVAPFPASGVKTAASVGGGRMPRWRRDGRELYYVDDEGRLMVVPLDPAGAPGPPRELFRIGAVTDIDVTPDGAEFVAVLPVSIAREQPLSVIVNWPVTVR